MIGRLTAATISTFLFLYPNAVSAADPQFVHLTGHYSDEDLVKGAAPHSLPMTFLYDADDHLVPVDQWPADLAKMKKHVSDGYCCVSDSKPAHAGEPPADCIKLVFGTDAAANFKGLMDASGKPILKSDIPAHKWLLVVYGATWCAPCLKEAAALKEFFATSPHANQYVWVTLDVTRMIQAQSAAKARTQ